MRLKEAFERYVPEAAKKFIPLEAESLGHFADLVKSENCTRVRTIPVIKIKYYSPSSRRAIPLAEYEFSTRYASKTREHRQIVFNEPHTQGNCYLYNGEDKDKFRRAAELRGLVTAEARLGELHHSLIVERNYGVRTEGPTKHWHFNDRIQFQVEVARHDIKPYPKLVPKSDLNRAG